MSRASFSYAHTNGSGDEKQHQMNGTSKSSLRRLSDAWREYKANHVEIEREASSPRRPRRRASVGAVSYVGRSRERDRTPERDQRNRSRSRSKSRPSLQRSSSNRDVRRSRSKSLTRVRKIGDENSAKPATGLQNVRVITRLIGQPDVYKEFDYDIQRHQLILDPLEKGGRAKHVLPVDEIIKDSFCHHESTFSRVGEPECRSVFEGYDSTIVLVGSDPTTILFGREWPVPGEDDYQRGMLLRAVSWLMDKLKKDPHVIDYWFEMGAFQTVTKAEGHIVDLLNEQPDQDEPELKLRDGQKGVYIQGLQPKQFRTVDEFRQLVRVYLANRIAFDVPEWGPMSPHRVIQLRMNRQAADFKIVAHLTFVILEQTPSVSLAADNALLKEYIAMMNRARWKLSQCFRLLADNRVPPFRDTALTHSLKEALTGPGKLTGLLVGFGQDRGYTHRMPTEHELELMEHVLWLREFTKRQNERRNMSVASDMFYRLAIPEYTRRLARILKIHNPSKLKSLPVTIEKHRDNLHGLYVRACEKYDEEPEKEFKLDDQTLEALQVTEEPEPKIRVPLEKTFKEMISEIHGGVIAQPRQRQLEDLWTTADANENGRLDLDELETLLRAYLAVARQVALDQIRSYEVELMNLGGVVGFNMSRLMQPMREPTNAYFDEKISQLDRNNRTVLAFLLQYLDRNHDGIVDRQDFDLGIPQLFFGDANKFNALVDNTPECRMM